MEQGIMARAVATRLGAGLHVSSRDRQAIAAALDQMLSTDQFALAARQFSQRHPQPDPTEHLHRILDQIAEDPHPADHGFVKIC